MTGNSDSVGPGGFVRPVALAWVAEEPPAVPRWHRYRRPGVAVTVALLAAVPFLAASGQADPDRPAPVAQPGNGSAPFYDAVAEPPASRRATPPPVPVPTPVASTPAVPVAPVAPPGPPVDPAAAVPDAPNRRQTGRVNDGANPAPGTAVAPAPVQAPPPAPPQRPTYVAVAGPGCKAGMFSVSGEYSDGKKGWYSTGGGWTGDGCSGTAKSVPMSGAAAKDDAGNYTVWAFTTGPVTSGTCAIRIWVPGTGRWQDAGGDPAYYFVSTNGGGSWGNGFTVGQRGHQGSWMSGPTVPISGGRIAVKLVNRGLDWGADRAGAHLSAAQVEVRCS